MTQANYTRRLRGAMTGYWNGSLTRDDFLQVMQVQVIDGLTAAYLEGAKAAGIASEDELTDAEARELNDAIKQESTQLDNLADFIRDHNKAAGTKLTDLLAIKLDLWALRYADVAGRARITTGKDKKYKWVLGPTEHCTTCAKLANLVHRGSQWRNYVLPQNPPNEQLECGGWRCQCALVETSERASRRYPPVP